MGRPPNHYEIDQLREVARMAYEEGKDNTQIAEELKKDNPAIYDKITRDKVRKMLLQARERNVVTISFPENVGRMEALQEAVKTRFSFLDKVIVVPTIPDERYESLLARWGHEAARYFDKEVSLLRSNGERVRVGITGGQSLLAFANAVGEDAREHVEIHTLALVGRGRDPELPPDEKAFTHVNPIVNATILWTKCGGIPGNLHYATIPPYSGKWTRNKLRDELLKLKAQDEIMATLKAMMKVDIAFVGLGAFETAFSDDKLDAQLTATKLLEPIIKQEELRKEKVVGDLGYIFFGEDGRYKSKWDFFLTPGSLSDFYPGLNFYKRMVEIDGKFQDKGVTKNGVKTVVKVRQTKKVVVIAGKHKLDAIMGALAGELFNVWITDEETAQQVLSQNDPSEDTDT